MTTGNTETSFGWFSRVLHWAMAVLVIGLLVLGLRIHNMEVSLSNIWLFGLHKSFGLLAFAALILRLFWHRISPPPRPIPSPGPWKDRAARIVHLSFYGLLLLIPLTGWIGSAATGTDVTFFGVVLPSLVPASPAIEDTAFIAHGVLTKLLIALLILHVLGAFSRRDGTLRRIVFGTVNSAADGSRS